MKGVFQMTKKLLKQHRALKREMEELNIKIFQEQEKEEMSKKDFPYIERYDVEQEYIRKKLINEYNERKTKVEKETLEIESFISSIPDAETRLIFQYSFIDGMKQREIAEKLHMERSSISKKITEILQLSQKSVLY